MTEAEWLAFTDPGPELDFLQTSSGATERKLRRGLLGGSGASDTASCAAAAPSTGALPRRAEAKPG